MEVTRTLVKSPPELWAELSDVAALARHLGEFGTIRIVRTEPESVVEWEGDRASGSVRLEPSGWGTRVTLTAEAAPEPEPEPDESAAEASAAPGSPPSEPVLEATAATAETQAAPPRRRGFLARLFRRREREAPPIAVAVGGRPCRPRRPRSAARDAGRAARARAARAAGRAPARRGGGARPGPPRARLRPPPALLALTRP